MSRSRILILLLVLLGVAIGYAWWATPRQQKAGSVSNRSHVAMDKGEMNMAFQGIASLDLSGNPPSKYHPPVRDLFGTLYRAPRPVRPKPVAVTKSVVKPAPVIAPQTVTPIVETAPRQKPIPPLSVLGYLDKNKEFTVFLGSPQGEIYLLKQGDRFADDLEVWSIDRNGITVARRQTDQRVVLPLGEARSQRLPTVRFQSDRPAFVPQEFDADKPDPGQEPEQAQTPGQLKSSTETDKAE